MSNEVKAIRHFGLFRTGLTTEQAQLDRNILKHLFRRGSKTEGTLANYCQMRLTSEEWRSAIERLVSYNLIEFKPALYGDSRRVSLTADGSGWAMDFCCEEQVVPPGTPADHLKMAAEKQ